MRPSAALGIRKRNVLPGFAPAAGIQRAVGDAGRAVRRGLARMPAVMGGLLIVAAGASLAARRPPAAPMRTGVWVIAVVAVLLAAAATVRHWRCDTMRRGRQGDPYAAVGRLGCCLKQAAEPAAVLQKVAQTVSAALRVPAVAIELIDGGSARMVARHGRRGVEALEPEAFAMTYQGRVVGRLLVTPSPSRVFTTAERDLLHDLARQAGQVVHGMGVTADLRRSRERLVRSREEEHRRLRRGLHDELGPWLAGMTMQVGAARALLAMDTAAAEGVLGELERGLQACVIEVRRLVDDLRPPALDQLGLLSGIRQRLSAFTATATGSALETSLNAPDDLDELPAAVEVAAYRIVTEAVANTLRHAAASHCDIRLTVRDRLVVEVVDNGVGLPDCYRAGVGLASMREQAEELGGTFIAQRLPHRGTRIRAELPLAMAAQ